MKLELNNMTPGERIREVLYEGESRSIRRAVGFLAASYIIYLAFIMLAGLDLKLDGTSVVQLLYSSAIYLTVGLMFVSQAWYLILKPLTEHTNNETQTKATFMLLTLTYILLVTYDATQLGTLTTRSGLEVPLRPLIGIIIVGSPLYALIMPITVHQLDKHAKDQSTIEYIFKGPKGRSPLRALTFFILGYTSFAVLAVLWMLGGIARGMSGVSSPAPSLTWWLLAYTGFGIAIISQLWYLLLKPIYEDSSYRTRKAVILTLCFPTILIMSDYLLWAFGVILEFESRARLIPYSDLNTLGDQFIVIGPVYIILFSVAFAWKNYVQ